MVGYCTVQYSLLWAGLGLMGEKPRWGLSIARLRLAGSIIPKTSKVFHRVYSEEGKIPFLRINAVFWILTMQTDRIKWLLVRLGLKTVESFQASPCLAPSPVINKFITTFIRQGTSGALNFGAVFECALLPSKGCWGHKKCSISVLTLFKVEQGRFRMVQGGWSWNGSWGGLAQAFVAVKGSAFGGISLKEIKRRLDHFNCLFKEADCSKECFYAVVKLEDSCSVRKYLIRHWS